MEAGATARAAPEDLRREVAALRWYHTIDLGHGVRTPGYFDTIAAVERIPFPKDLSGRRCLDVGTANGFWAFEMERRGAAEVVATDVPSAELDWPPGSEPADRSLEDAGARRTFAVARDALGSRVRYENCSIYELSPERVGTFDFVFIGSLLLHLRDPVQAIGALRSVCTGTVLSADAVSLALSLARRRPAASLASAYESYWWTPNAACHRRWFEAAAFEIVDPGRIYLMPVGAGYEPPPAGAVAPIKRQALDLALRRFGLPHHWLIARAGPRRSG